MKIKRVAGIIAAAALFAVMCVGTGLAADVSMEDKAADVLSYTTVIGFGGHEWWVIGDEYSAFYGVYCQEDSVTLLAKNNDFGKVEFRKKSDTEKKGYKQYDDGKNTYWYEENFDNYPSDYKGSMLQRKMEALANEFKEKERNQINGRTLTESDQIVWPKTGSEKIEDIKNQKLWALSFGEWQKTAQTGTDVAGFGDRTSDHYWLRSPYLYYGMESYVGWSPGKFFSFASKPVGNLYAVRPALNLNIKSVIFTSEAKGTTSKNSTPLGGGLVSVRDTDTISNKIKYTFKDDSLKLDTVYVSRLENGTATVKYIGASPGKTLSVIVKDETGTVTHYGRLAENITESGQASLQLPSSFDPSKDKIQIFVEEINGENESDFASDPKDLDMTIKNMVTVNGGKGGGLYEPGTEVTLIADAPEQGKYFKGWSISPSVTLTEGTNTSGIIKFNMLSEDVNATAVYDSVIYPVTGGDNSIWQQGSEDGLKITSEGEFRKFLGVSVDGNMLDKSHYDKKGGSTIIILKPSYLSTLSVGDHIMRIHFTDGYTETRFSIAEAVAEPNVPETTVAPAQTTTVQETETTVAQNNNVSPKTGDKNKLWLIGALIVSTGAAFVSMEAIKKRQSR